MQPDMDGEGSQVGPTSSRVLWAWFAVIFLVSFGVRSALLFSPTTPGDCIAPESISEVGRVAQTLYRTGAFADGYVVPSGPTAHPLPIYTWFLSRLYHLFGLTLAAGYVRCLVHIAVCSVLYGLMPWLAGRLGLGRPAGVLAGVVGALFPHHGLHEILGWSGSERLAAIALALLMVAMVRRWSAARVTVAASLLVGVGFGIAFHQAPALLLVLIGFTVFEFWRFRGRHRWAMTGVMALGAVIACVPWAWRNYATFGEVFFIRSNLGLELRVANHDGAAADMDVMDAREGASMRHPGANRAEALRVRELGEMEYMRQARNEALSWIAARPGAFARLTASRFVHFWFGPLHDQGMMIWITLLTVLAVLGARRVLPALTVPQRAAIFIPLATFPLVYYVVTYMFRYRIPVHWILVLLAAAEVWYWFRRIAAYALTDRSAVDSL